MSSPFVPAHLAVGDLSTVAVRIAPVVGGKGLQAELDGIRQSEREHGYAQGIKEGRKDGFLAGHREGHALGESLAREEAARRRQEEDRALADELESLRARMKRAWEEFLRNAHEELTSRTMDVTRAVLAQELSLSREGALEIVRRCLDEVSHGEEFKIRISVEDLPTLEERAEELREYLDGRDVEFVADKSIAAGCIVESSGGRVDGRVLTSLELIENELRKAA